jgi:hypothetical protein
MIDDPDPGPDPLAGRDPHPREQIDLWPLHDARQELLEEIVSQPGPGGSAGRHKILLSVVGIAAALALVAGGAWAVTRDDADGGKDDQVVAAQSSDATATETPTATTTTTTEPPRKRRRGDDVRLNGVRVGKVRVLGDCHRNLSSRLVTLRELQRLPRLRNRPGDRWAYVIKRKGECRVVFERVPAKPRRQP